MLLPRLARISLLLLVSLPHLGVGGVVFEFEEVGNDVVLSGEGHLSSSGLSLFAASAPIGGRVNPSDSVVAGAPGALVDVYDLPLDFTGPTEIGPGSSLSVADSGSGHAFGLNFDTMRLGIRQGGSGPHSGSATWLNTDLATLGLTPGSYQWIWGTEPSRDKVVVHVRSPNCTDLDGDGYGASGHPECPGGPVPDCDDADPLSFPGAADFCDAVDNDCDLAVDEGSVCTAALVDGVQLTFTVDLDNYGLLPAIQFPLVLGGVDYSGPLSGTDMLATIDVEDGGFFVVLIDNPSGGNGNVRGTATLTGLSWVDASTQITDASVASEFDYVYASAPTPFPPPGLASIVDAGHGVEIYFEEMLFQSGEARETVVHLPEPGAASRLGAGIAGLGALALRRRRGRA